MPTGCVLADEERIATVAESLIGDEGPKIEKQVALDAVARLEERLVASLTATQQEVAIGLLASGHRLDVVVGVAGSGKTTTLAAVRDGFERTGYTVLGTATSGQAQPRTLEMAPESTRAASLTWRLNHNTLEISDRHVLILDKGANLRCRPPPAPHRRGAIRSKADRRGRRPPTRRNRPRWRPHRTCRTPPPAALGAQRQHPPHLPGRTWSALSAPRRRHRLCGRLVCPQRPGPSTVASGWRLRKPRTPLFLNTQRPG